MNSIKNKINIIGNYKTIKDIQRFVNDYVTYTRDIDKTGVKDWWQWPCETLKDKTADCEDHAILMIAMVYQELDIKCNMIIAWKYKEGKKVHHAIVEHEGIWYDSTSKKTIDKFNSDWNLKRTIPFWWLDWEIRIRRLFQWRKK